METIIPFALLAVVFYLLIIRPMQSRQKQVSALRRMQDALSPGTRIMLTSGIHGIVTGIDEDNDTILLQIAPGTDITVAKAAVAVVDADEQSEDS